MPCFPGRAGLLGCAGMLLGMLVVPAPAILPPDGAGALVAVPLPAVTHACLPPGKLRPVPL